MENIDGISGGYSDKREGKHRDLIAERRLLTSVSDLRTAYDLFSMVNGRSFL